MIETVLAVNHHISCQTGRMERVLLDDGYEFVTFDNDEEDDDE